MSPVEGKFQVAIIGVGSPFGDDQLGWQAVEWLMHSGLSQRFSHMHLAFNQADRPGALLLEQLRGTDAAIIIDAMQSGAVPGTLRAFTLEQLLAQPSGLLSSHAFGVAQTLALGASLGGLPRMLRVLGIEMGAETGGAQLMGTTAHQLVSNVEAILTANDAVRNSG